MSGSEYGRVWMINGTRKQQKWVIIAEPTMQKDKKKSCCWWSSPLHFPNISSIFMIMLIVKELNLHICRTTTSNSMTYSVTILCVSHGLIKYNFNHVYYMYINSKVPLFCKSIFSCVFYLKFVLFGIRANHHIGYEIEWVVILWSSHGRDYL
jgi:hypothetical protein